MKILIAMLAIVLATIGSADAQRPEEVTVFTGTWFITFNANGGASAQYGSNPGDSGFVDAGTVKFDELLADISKARRKETKAPMDRFQIAIRHKGEVSITAFTITDEAWIETLLLGLEDRWKPHQGGQRFDELRKKYPMVEQRKDNSEQPTPPYSEPAARSPQG